MHAHRALEQRLEIARPDARDEAYARYLEAVWGWLAPLEPPLWGQAWPESVTPCERDGKAAWAAADLRARGLRAEQIAALPRQTALPPLASLAQRFGVAYVIEGAQLGGQVLLRELGPRVAPLPTRWLSGYGHDTANKWRSFLSALTLSLREPFEVEEAAESARVTFELVHGWFARRGIA
jgi:heme oxygenase